MFAMVVFFVLAGCFLIGLSIPLIRGRVKPNGWYGFRITLTLNNPEIWYPVNRFAGWWLLGYAIVLVIAALWLPGLPGMTLDGYGIWMATIALAGITLVFVTGWIYARRLAHGFAKEDSTGSP